MSRLIVTESDVEGLRLLREMLFPVIPFEFAVSSLPALSESSPALLASLPDASELPEASPSPVDEAASLEPGDRRSLTVLRLMLMELPVKPLLVAASEFPAALSSPLPFPAASWIELAREVGRAEEMDGRAGTYAVVAAGVTGAAAVAV